MSSMADLLNIPKKLEFEGKTYELREPTVPECAEYSLWLEQEARDAIARDVYAPDKQREADRRALRDDIAAGCYEYGSPAFVKSLESWKGSAKLMSIVLKIDEDTALRMVRAKALELAEAFNAALVGDDEDAKKKVTGLLRGLGFSTDFFSSSSSTRRSTGRGRKSGRRRTGGSGKSGARSRATSTATPSPPPGAGGPAACPSETSSSAGSS